MIPFNINIGLGKSSSMTHRMIHRDWRLLDSVQLSDYQYHASRLGREHRAWEEGVSNCSTMRKRQKRAALYSFPGCFGNDIAYFLRGL